MKFCPKCKQVLPLEAFNKNQSKKDGLVGYCKTCMAAYGKTYRAKNITKARKWEKAWRDRNRDSCKKADRRHKLKKLYSLTEAEFSAMIARQLGGCAICGQQFKVSLHTHVDHCHVTKKVRGILCAKCNLMLGHAKDSLALLRQAAEYLEQFPQQKAEEYQTKRQKQKKEKLKSWKYPSNAPQN